MIMPPPYLSMSEYRNVAREVNRLARIVQGTMSLEGQGLDLRDLHDIKKKMVIRLVKRIYCVPPETGVP